MVSSLMAPLMKPLPWGLVALDLRLSTAIVLACLLFTPWYNPHHIVHDQPMLDTYDYVIVGGGTAGCVLAARLSEDPHVSVLLLEAGEAGSVFSLWPVLSKLMYGNKKYDWKFNSVRDEGYCVGMTGKVCKLPRGKILGGNSAFNRLTYVRGNRHDFDQWEALGNPGWAYQDLLPYFIRAEDNTDPHLHHSPYHGVGGAIKVSPPRFLSDLAPVFLKAAVLAGYEVGDINGDRQSRFMLYQTTGLHGERWSTARGYLAPASHRPNLHVVVHALTTRVMINPVTRKTEGVEFYRNKKKRRVVWARREVIVSAGVFNSPKLLKLSGIGPRLELRKFGIPCIKELPGVGENLQSHFGQGGIDFLVDQLQGHGLTGEELFSVTSLAKYASEKTGPLATYMGMEGTGFVSTRFNNVSDYHGGYVSDYHSDYRTDWPDVQLLFFPTQLGVDGGTIYRDMIGIGLKLWWKRYVPVLYQAGFRIVPVNLRPRSRGRVTLRSRNVFQHPDIFLNLFDHPHDINVMREGARIAEKLGVSPAFLRVGAKPNNKPNPFCYLHPAGGPDWWECRARVFPETVFSDTSTCAMGPPDDHYAVVDNQLRVYGVSGLRVVDASIFPRITSGDPTAATIAVAERTSDLITAYWHAVHENHADPSAYVNEHVLLAHAHQDHAHEDHHHDGGHGEEVVKEGEVGEGGGDEESGGEMGMGEAMAMIMKAMKMARKDGKGVVGGMGDAGVMNALDYMRDGMRYEEKLSDNGDNMGGLAGMDGMSGINDMDRDEMYNLGEMNIPDGTFRNPEYPLTGPSGRPDYVDSGVDAIPLTGPSGPGNAWFPDGPVPDAEPEPEPEPVGLELAEAPELDGLQDGFGPTEPEGLGGFSGPGEGLGGFGKPSEGIGGFSSPGGGFSSPGPSRGPPYQPNNWPGDFTSLRPGRKAGAAPDFTGSSSRLEEQIALLKQKVEKQRSSEGDDAERRRRKVLAVGGGYEDDGKRGRDHSGDSKTVTTDVEVGHNVNFDSGLDSWGSKSSDVIDNRTETDDVTTGSAQESAAAAEISVQDWAVSRRGKSRFTGVTEWSQLLEPGKTDKIGGESSEATTMVSRTQYRDRTRSRGVTDLEETGENFAAGVSEPLGKTNQGSHGRGRNTWIADETSVRPKFGSRGSAKFSGSFDGFADQTGEAVAASVRHSRVVQEETHVSRENAEKSTKGETEKRPSSAVVEVSETSQNILETRRKKMAARRGEDNQQNASGKGSLIVAGVTDSRKRVLDRADNGHASETAAVIPVRSGTGETKSRGRVVFEDRSRSHTTRASDSVAEITGGKIGESATGETEDDAVASFGSRKISPGTQN